VKNITDKLFWVALVILGFYMMYQKGWILTNFKSVEVKVAYDMMQSDEGNLTILDVRTPQEYKEGHIANSQLVPLQALASNLSMVDKSKTVLVYCRSGSRSVSASRILSDNGFTVINMKGGLMVWGAENYPLEQ